LLDDRIVCEAALKVVGHPFNAITQMILEKRVWLRSACR
jgi:hypothetical protein